MCTEHIPSNAELAVAWARMRKPLRDGQRLAKPMRIKEENEVRRWAARSGRHKWN